MSASTKLTCAVQALCFLARSGSGPQSSEDISRATGIHATRIRGILSMLAKQSIVHATRGLSGGFSLTRPPEKIHLQEVYCAVETRKAFHLDISKSDADISSAVNDYFFRLFADIQIDIEGRMRGISIAHVLSFIQATQPLSSSSGRG